MDYRLPVGILAGQTSPYVFARCAEGASGAMLFIKGSRSKHTRNLWTRHKSAVGHEILCHVTQSMLLPQHLLPVLMFFFVTPTHRPLVLTEKKSFQKRQNLRTEISSHLLPPKKHPLQSYESTNRVSGLDKRHKKGGRINFMQLETEQRVAAQGYKKKNKKEKKKSQD